MHGGTATRGISSPTWFVQGYVSQPGLSDLVNKSTEWDILNMKNYLLFI